MRRALIGFAPNGLHIQTQLPINHLVLYLHTATTKQLMSMDDSQRISSLICDFVRRNGASWDSMSKNFGSIKLTHSIIEQVLLELKDPKDARPALSFFHWSSHQPNNVEHGIHCYCIIIHTLVRARLLIDAKALLDSIVRKSAKDGSSGGLVVKTLFTSYKNMDSTPLVFDLLLQTYSKLRMFETAFEACQCIEELGFSCSLISFNTLIHLVQKSDRNELVWKIYQYMIDRRTYPNEYTTRIMISALCKEGNLQKSIDVLDRIHGKRCLPGVIVNTSLVLRMFEEEIVDEGIILMKRMLQKNIIIDDVSYSLIIYAKLKTNNLKSALELYDEMLKRGFHANPFLYTLFISAHCKEGRTDEAINLLQEMRSRGFKPYSETYNVLIEGCCKEGRIKESLGFCEEMVNGELLPSCSAFNEMVRNLCEMKDVQRANALLTVMLERGFVPNVATYSYLMDGYGNEGEVQEVLKLYYEMEYKNFTPSLMTYASLIRSQCLVGNLKEAEKFLQVMEDRSVAPNEYIFEILISGYCKHGNMVKARHHYDEMARRGLKSIYGSFKELVNRTHNASYSKKELDT
ncbi:hypothetical protein ACHQM5_021006 [Ranunculus cassubicifolius]